MTTGEMLRTLTDGLDASLDLGLAEFKLWEVIDGDLTGLVADDLEAIITEVLVGPWAPRKWAILAALGPSLAVATVMAAVAEERGFGERVRAFADRNNAMEWFGICDLPPTPAQPDEAFFFR